jgi:hypothetical protein
MKRVSDFMAWLGGGDPEIMAQVPRSRTRFIQMAGVLLTTSGIAVLSMIFALHDGVKVPLLSALVLGLLWGVVILNLDRFLVLSMDSGRGRWNLLLMALPRLALAAVLSLVISTPMVLRIFASDIGAQIKITQLKNSANEAKLELQSKEVQEYNAVQAKIDKDKAILAGNGPTTVYPPLQTDMSHVASLTPIVQRDHQAALSAYEKWQCELQGQTGAGCPSTSGRAGNGARATTDQQAYKGALATYNQDNAQLQQWLGKEKTDQAAANGLQITSLATERRLAKQDLATQTAQASKLELEIQRIQTQDTAANQADTGILAQLQALSDASSQNPALKAAQLLVTLVFFLIEILPVTVKVLLSLAPPTTYDLIARTREEQIADKARTEQVENRRLAELASDARVSIAGAKAQSQIAEAQSRANVETDRIAKKETLEKQANTRVVGEMGRIVEATLDKWSQEIQATVAASSGTRSANGTTPPVNGTAPLVNGSGSPAAASTSSGNGHPVGFDSDDLLSPGFLLPDSDDL